MENGLNKTSVFFQFPYAGIIQIRLKGCNLSSILDNRIVAPRTLYLKEPLTETTQQQFKRTA